MFPNCTARPGGGKQLVGPQLLEAANVSGLTVRRPIERGYLTNPDLQVRLGTHGRAHSWWRPRRCYQQVRHVNSRSSTGSPCQQWGR